MTTMTDSMTRHDVCLLAAAEHAGRTGVAPHDPTVTDGGVPCPDAWTMLESLADNSLLRRTGDRYILTVAGRRTLLRILHRPFHPDTTPYSIREWAEEQALDLADICHLAARQIVDGSAKEAAQSLRLHLCQDREVLNPEHAYHGWFAAMDTDHLWPEARALMQRFPDLYPPEAAVLQAWFHHRG